MTDKKDPPKIILVQNHLRKLNDYRYNVVTGNVEYLCKTCKSWSILDDFQINSLVRSLAITDIGYPVSYVRNLFKSDFTQKFDPFKSYFSSLPEWDGTTDYIQQLAETVETDNNPLWHLSFRKWIVALVTCVLVDKVVNHTMIVFTGEQGVGKTTWLLNLVPKELKDYLYSGTINPENKDTMIYLSECILINLDELENLNGRQLGATKELITKNQIRMRRTYGTIYENLPRRASFAGSVNHKEFLSDTSGSRRFLCFETTSINFQHSIPMDMVYSQALSLSKAGFQFWFDSSENKLINKSNEKYRITSLEEEELFRHFEPCDKEDATDFLCTSDILDLILDKHRNLINNGSKLRLGRILSAHKFIKTTRDNKKVYCLRRKDQTATGYRLEFSDNSD